MSASPGNDKGAERPPVTIKKYANRRLYNTATSSYVTLDHLAGMVRDGVDFVVYDAKSGEDITRSVLTQIIFEEESKGQNLLPIQFLRQLICFYGDSLQKLVPRYLEASMDAFARNQEQMRRTLGDAFGEMFSFRQLEDVGRQNMAMFEQAMSMWKPFVPGSDAERNTHPAPGSQSAPEDAGAANELHRLREQLDRIQRQLDELTEKK